MWDTHIHRHRDKQSASHSLLSPPPPSSLSQKHAVAEVLDALGDFSGRAVQCICDGLAERGRQQVILLTQLPVHTPLHARTQTEGERETEERENERVKKRLATANKSLRVCGVCMCAYECMCVCVRVCVGVDLGGGLGRTLTG
jgi:hypothetical protein